MQKDSAKKLIQETLQGSFNKEQFIYLAKNVLNHIEEAPFTYKGNFVFDDFADSIQSVERIGKYQDPEEKLIDVLIVRLKKEASLDRARTRQRNFVAKYLKGSRGGVLKDAALVAFVSPNDDDWRFSLVKMEYKFNDKGKVEEEFTPARRYSFLVGKHENSHTAQSRLLPLLLNDEVNPTLKELEDVFSVEKVTKEFFEKYRDLFLKLKESLDEIVKKDKKLKEDFKAKDINTIDFTKKLLGQIVFLYFLQKKGWFGVERNKKWGSGSKRFLRELFEKKHGDYKNFFNEILEPLFYEALRLERTGDYYSRFDCRIPFLNGGLFDPLNDYDWVDTEIELPNEIFSNEIKDAKTGDVGTGILDVFDRYNFTVKEDEPLEKEVAVDPEMLGKVFENLLEVKDRKSKGTYYTPREIVHYMCQESLANYLTTELEGKASKEDIETLIKYGESVVEHDSRVVGMVNEGLKTKRYASFKLPQSVRKHAKEIDDKLASIRVCDPAVGSGAFPVGMMNEVIRTRNALTAYIGKDGDRTPYNFKRHAIQNCLYGVDIDAGAVEIAKLRLWLSLIVEEEERATIQPLPNLDYKIVQGNSLLSVEKNLFNQVLFTQLEQLKPLYFNETSASKKQGYKEKINELINQITNGHKDFDFEVYFSEVFHEKKGFDVVIANPPYITYKGKQRVRVDKKEIEFYPKIFINSAEYKINSFALFIEQGTKILATSGILSYIIPSTFLQNEYLGKIRKYLLNYFHIEKIITFGNKVFEAVTDSIILFVSKNQSGKETDVIRKDNLIFSPDDKKLVFNQSQWIEKDDSVIHIRSSEKNQRLLEKIESGSVFLDKFFEANIGIKRATAPITDYPQGGYKKFLVGRDIGKYRILSGNKYILFDTKYFHTSVDENIFLKPEKVLVRKTGGTLIVAFDDQQYYTDQSIYNIYPRIRCDILLKFVLALLNSRLMNFYFNQKMVTNADVYPYIKGIHLKKLPIKEAQPSAQELIIKFVDKILTITKTDNLVVNSANRAKVHEYEKQIDQLVYKLYGLTPEEIKIVENGK